jgi:uncharacterized membrane protein YqiK
MGCSSSRNVESKKNRILEEAQQALNDRRVQEARKKELLDAYFKAHAEATKLDAEAAIENDGVKREALLQQMRDCIQRMHDFKKETGFKPRNLQRNDPVFQEAAWSDFLDVKGIQVSQLVEMDGDADEILSRCSHVSASPSDPLSRILLKTRETAETARRVSVDAVQAARRMSVDLGQNLMQGANDKASTVVPGRA